MAIGGGGAVVVAVIMLLLGGDPATVLSNLLAGGTAIEAPGGAAIETSPEEDRLADMCSVVLADTEDTWSAIFAKMGRSYEYPKLVIFSGSVTSACGQAEAAMGPFYCSGDNSVYIDLSWYEELAAKFGAPGDFAQAYVIAHEVGHHVQNQLGILGEVHSAMRATSQEKANELSVRLELQADFFAGVWAHYADRSRDLLEAGDLEEALRAASAVGDDTIQKRTRGYVVPDSFTHGSAAQRLKYFKLGYETGDLEAFDLL